jgi:hypothetical protein
MIHLIDTTTNATHILDNETIDSVLYALGQLEKERARHRGKYKPKPTGKPIGRPKKTPDSEIDKN